MRHVRSSSAPSPCLIEALVAIPAVGLVVVITLALIADRPVRVHVCVQPSDSAQIRAILQAGELWAEHNDSWRVAPTPLDDQQAPP